MFTDYTPDSYSFPRFIEKKIMNKLPWKRVVIFKTGGFGKTVSWNSRVNH
jgi:hypothetical protein